MMIAVLVLTTTILAASAPADSVPTPHAAPKTARKALIWSGQVRAFYFARTNGNTCLTSSCKPKGTPNSQAFNSGVKLQATYSFGRSPFSVGATYFGATPFAANPSGVLGVGYNPKVDNTLPGYALSTLGEMYAQYRTPGILFRTGKQVINTPWANAADSRMVPIAFQGSFLTATLSPQWQLQAMYVARFKSRVTSAFNANTLLTSCNTANPTGKGPIPGIPGDFTVEGDQCNTQQTTKGFLLFSATYASHGLTANAYQYHMYDLVDLTYVDAKYDYAQNSFADPSLAVQYWSNTGTGRALLGNVHSHGYGFVFSRNLVKNVALAVSFNQQSMTSLVVPSAACNGTASSGTKPGPGKIFGGVPDTNVKNVPAGDVLCYAGGTASPYTDSYESDPLYTSTIGEGLTDARKGGFAYKIALTAQTANRRLQAILAQARYNVSLPGSSGGGGNTDVRTETNIDVQYFFNPVVAHEPYHGLSLRERWVGRSQTFTPFQFDYARTQLEYSF